MLHHLVLFFVYVVYWVYEKVKALKHMGYLDSQFLSFVVIDFHIQSVLNVDVTFEAKSVSAILSHCPVVFICLHFVLNLEVCKLHKMYPKGELLHIFSSTICM